MSFVIIPNYIDEEIDRRLDAAIKEHPGAAADREVLRQQLVDYFAVTGLVPDFSLQKKESAP